MDRNIDTRSSSPGERMELYRFAVVGEATYPLRVALVSSLEERGLPVITVPSIERLSIFRTEDKFLENVLFLIAPEVSQGLLESLQHLQQAQMTILMVSDDHTGHAIEKATHCGAHAYLTNVPSGPHLGAVISAAVARSKMMQSMSTELHAVRRTLKERKVVERAKGILMHRKALDEATAYRAMQKMAMNRNVKLIKLAQSMIDASELLDISN